MHIGKPTTPGKPPTSSTCPKGKTKEVTVASYCPARAELTYCVEEYLKQRKESVEPGKQLKIKAITNSKMSVACGNENVEMTLKDLQKGETISCYIKNKVFQCSEDWYVPPIFRTSTVMSS